MKMNALHLRLHITLAALLLFSGLLVAQKPTTVSKSSQITNMAGSYILEKNFEIDVTIGTSSAPFTGTIDGQLLPTKATTRPFIAYANGATIKNVIIGSATISGGTNVGAICNELIGTSTQMGVVYNCGVLGGSISGTGNVGGLVGNLGQGGNTTASNNNCYARVINCYSYADITGGDNVGGIVGYNFYKTTKNALRSMVYCCMFYGDVTGGTNKAPVYNGQIISNKDGTGVGNFNYCRAEASCIQKQTINTYNCALLAETRFLQRFEFFRHLLNGHREMSAWWATGDVANTAEIAKWVMLPDSIGTDHPYPILKTWGRYPSVVNLDADNAQEGKPRNQGGKLGTLSVTIEMGTNSPFGAPNGATITTEKLNLVITDKDTTHFNYNYYKVQLPYYNDVGTKNYCTFTEGGKTTYRVVTGWKITKIEGGTTGTFSVPASDNTPADAPYYNYADRYCTNKDLYSVSGRIFNQGDYWDVPEGVKSITIQPYWAKAAFVADDYRDKVYNTAMDTPNNVETVGGGQWFTNGSEYTFTATQGSNNHYATTVKVYNTIGNAVTALGITKTNTVYDYAIVFVGNYHQYKGISNSVDLPYTIMSCDFDNDHEPDYSYILRFDKRTHIHPLRVDFLNVPGFGMAQKSTGGTGSYNFGIPKPRHWFEVTNTALFRVTQFEYSPHESGNQRVKQPIILQGGVIEQWVSSQGAANSSGDPGDRVTYFHMGDNVWFKEFHIGVHQDYKNPTPHPPVSITGGDYDEFYLTGFYRADANIYDDNAECYINGGRFGVVAGAGMEGIGTTAGKGNITWQIDHADMKEFYGGGINAANPAIGNINTTIKNSHVGRFCGGPKFGDMEEDRTVTTTATGCTFDTYFGAGFGGTSYSRYAPKNQSDVVNIDWNKWVKEQYKQDYSSTFKGVSTQINYQFIPMSGNTTNVARLFVEYAKFSLATTNNVTSTLTNCTINRNFYGGGSLGKVAGDVESTLDDCTVHGNVFGAGYSAALPTVEVDSIGFRTEPYYYTDLGTYRTAVKGKTTTYKWEHSDKVNSTVTAIDTEKHILYTTEKLEDLGTVAGDVTLNITGKTTVEGKIFNEKGDEIAQTGGVYGGGDESEVTGKTKTVRVNISSETTTPGVLNQPYLNNVFGGGNEGNVASNVEVTIGSDKDVTPYIKNDVYGGGALANVNHDENNHTTVIVHRGTIDGNVYGGGLGRLEDEAHHISAVEAKVNGPVTVTVDGGSMNKVFGCNNLNGAPQNTVLVTVEKGSGSLSITDVYGGGNQAAYEGSPVVHIYNGTITNNVYGGGLGETAVVTGTPAVTVGDLTSGHDAYVARVNGDVYCGGDAANVQGETSVTIQKCNTVIGGDVYGGGNAADIVKDGTEGGNTSVVITGGTINSSDEAHGNVFGGGHGNKDANPQVAANVAGNTSVEVNGGTVKRVFGGSNSKGDIGGSTGVTVEKDNDACELRITEVYGGGNLAEGKAGRVNIVCTGTTEKEGVGDVYGGAKAAAVTGDIELNITGGKIDRVFGGNNVSGNIDGDITVNVEWDASTCANNSLNYVYGGGNQAAYSQKTAGHPAVNIYNATISNNVYGGGLGETAVVTGVPTVIVGDIRDGKEDNRATVNGDVYGGGDAANVVGTTSVLIQQCHTVIGGDVYGGGNAADIVQNGTEGGNTSVVITGGTINSSDEAHGNVFGGGHGDKDANPQVAANVEGDTRVDVKGGTVKRVFGGSNSKGDIGGSTGVTVEKDNDACDLHIDEVYGGGNLAEGKAGAVNIVCTGTKDNEGVGDVYGGAKAAPVTGDITLNITGGKIDRVFGGNNVSGAIDGDITVNVEWDASTCTTNSLNNVYGGGNQAAYSQKTAGHPAVNIYNATISNNVYGGGLGETAVVTGVPTVIVGDIRDGKEDNRATVNGDVYGGGDAADVKGTTSVTIQQCYTLVNGDVYGGGNAADIIKNGTAGGNTSVVVTGGTINSSDEDHGNVFGGGHGDKDANPQVAANVEGDTRVDVKGGTVKRVFGGSNSKGDIAGSTAVNVEKGADACDLHITEVYGGGNQAAGKAGQVNIVCTGGNTEGVGDVYGGAKEANVTGDITLNITGGRIDRVFGGNNVSGAINGGITVNVEWDDNTCANNSLGSVFGGGNEADYTGTPDVNIIAGTVTNSVYGGGNEASVGGGDVSLEGGTVLGGIYGGCNTSGSVNGNVLVSLTSGTVGADGTPANVHGGGYGNGTSTTGNVEVSINGTSVEVFGDVYGGSAKGHVNAAGKTTTVTLDHGTIHGDLYGGGLGDATNEAKVFGDVQVTVKGGTVTGSVYGCNNVKGAPQSTVKVDINGTATPLSGFALANVFGGGNQAAYGGTPDVTIHNCNNSIGHVYGGGNQASVAGTNVVVYGGNTIGYVFGGGNGQGVAANYTMVSGDAKAYIYGGTIGKVFGGNNASGKIVGDVSLTVEKKTETGHSACPMFIEEVYGGGNEADGNAGSITINCTGSLVDGENGHIAHPENIGTTLEGIGTVYGGANKVAINNDITLNINNGIINKVFGGNNTSGVISGDIQVNINKTGDCGWYVGDVYGGGNHADYGGTPDVNLIAGTVYRDVYGGGNDITDGTKGVAGSDVSLEGGTVLGGIYGGCDTKGTVTTNTQVSVTSGTANEIYGGGRGVDTKVNGDVTVTVNQASGKTTTVNGKVYGGSALGSVNDATSDKTTVHILGGTLKDDIFGGGLGESGAGNASKGQVKGEIIVNIGAAPVSPSTDPTGNATIQGNVYGCNNTNGSPQHNVTVNVYKTAAVTAPAYAIDNVFGGGNLADFNVAGKTATVNIFGCDNAIERVFGGGNAAAAPNVTTNIEGGRFDYVFGGGNGETGTAANITEDVTLGIHGGTVNHYFAGSNRTGTISGETTLVVDNNGPCDNTNITEFFCGGNYAPITGNVETTIECGSNLANVHIDDLYGGCNMAEIDGNVVLTVKGGNYNNIYGGSKGATDPANITGDVTLTINGGSISEGVYGGCNVNGNINGQITVNIENTNTGCGWSVNNVFGGGNQASYGGTPDVNIKAGTVSGNVYGGGNEAGVGGGDVSLEGGTVLGGIYGGCNTKGTVDGDVVVSLTSGTVGVDGIPANVHGGGYGQLTETKGDVEVNINGDLHVYGDVYGGSAKGHVNAAGKETKVTLTNGTIHGDLYGGGLGDASNAAKVFGDVQVTVNGGTVTGSVYGCNNVNGAPQSTVKVDINGTDTPSIGFALAHVFGGGNAADYGDVPVVTVHNCNNSIEYVYGGGNAANVKGTDVTIYGGNAIDNVFGGCYGANVTTSGTNVKIYGGIVNHVYGGNNASGTIAGDIKVTVEKKTETGHATCDMKIGEVYGGGNVAASDAGTITIGCTGTGTGEGIDYVYGGANRADVTGPIELTITEGSIANVFGGNNNSGTITGGITVNIDKKASPCVWNIGNVFGGGNHADYSGVPDVNLKAGEVSGSVYGGGNQAGVGGGDVSLEGGTVLGGLYGGCNTSGVVDGDITVSLTSGTVGTDGTPANVHGGGYGNGTSTTGDVAVNINGSAVQVYGDVYGGSAKGHVNAAGKETNVTLTNGTVHGDLYGGGLGDGTYEAKVFGDVQVTIQGGTVTGSVYGCNNANGAPQSTVKVDVEAGTVNNNVFGGGNEAKYTGDPEVTIKGTGKVKKAVYGGGNNAEVDGNTIVKLQGGATVEGDVFGGGNNGEVTGNSEVKIQ